MRYLKTGLTELDESLANPGYTLLSPLYQQKSILIDLKGEVVHQWDLPGRPGNYAYMLENGNLLAATWAGGGPEGAAARGGRLTELDWDGNVVWEYIDEYQHHDFRRLKNGNTAYLGFELLPESAIADISGGESDEHHAEGVWGDYIREVNPAGETVWEWHAHEHLDFKKYPLSGPTPNHHEYAHPNTIVPLDDGNYLICYRLLDMVAIIDRDSGNYIWERRVEQWGGPHDVQFLDNGNMMLFANRWNKGPWRGSAIIEFDKDSGETIWEYRGDPTHTFDSHFISGCQRQPNGNTLICEGQWGRIFEVTTEGNIVWEYVNPFFSEAAPVAGVRPGNYVFRSYRYAADSPQIQGRLG